MRAGGRCESATPTPSLASCRPWPLPNKRISNPAWFILAAPRIVALLPYRFVCRVIPFPSFE